MIVESKQVLDEWCDSLGNWMDEHPTVYKVVLVVSHLFRAAMILAMIDWMQLPIFMSAGLMLIPSLLYRASVERFCVFRFTLPSWAGGIALWIARGAIGTVYAPLGAALLVGYGVMILYISHTDIEARMARLQAGHTSCH